MDQLRHLLYNTPTTPHPWDPSRHRQTKSSATTSTSDTSEPTVVADGTATPPEAVKRPTLAALQSSQPSSDHTPSASGSAKSSPRSFSSNMFSSHAQRYIASELRVSPNRGHPNICKLLDFFEDREFYYSEFLLTLSLDPT